MVVNDVFFYLLLQYCKLYFILQKFRPSPPEQRGVACGMSVKGGRGFKALTLSLKMKPYPSTALNDIHTAISAEPKPKDLRN